MYYVYLLKSDIEKHFYIGYSQDLRRRISEHKQGRVYYTKRYKPWRLVYYESYNEEEQARERERKLKQYGSAYYGLLKRLGYK